MMRYANSLPLPALVGLDLAQQALLLLAVEPRLRGMVISAGAGTGKSSLARGIRSLFNAEVPFLEAPTSADVENLLGGLDLEATLRTGRSVVRPGLLARAHEGFVYVDGINLLLDSSANLLLSVLDEGEVRVEREGISFRAPAHFRLIGSYDPAEGVPRSHLIDRVGLLVGITGNAPPDQRMGVIRNNLATVLELWQDELELLRGLVQAAQEQLPRVMIAPEQVEQISMAALAYGVQGHRVDLFAVYAACAAAALDLRDSVDDDDLALAMRLTILPRATQVPVPPSEAQPPPPQPAPPPTAMDDGQDESPQDEPADEEEPPEDDHQPESDLTVTPLEEQIFQALAGELPEDLDELPFRTVRRGRTGSRGATAGKRGRHVRSLPGDPRQMRIDVSATLRSAAPWQPLRRLAQSDVPTDGRTLFFEPADIRVKHYRSKAGALFCFGVDASGSMALHRMRQAKGAVHALLEKAYVKRDRVALLAFRGQKAELLMPPTQSVELARRALDLLPTGGGTPLASGLLLACEVAQQAKMRGIYQTVLILLTDGRANIALHEGGDIKTELAQLGRYVAESGVHVMVVDTMRNYLSRGEARQLAEWLGGDYAYLPNASGEAIAAMAADKAK